MKCAELESKSVDSAYASRHSSEEAGIACTIHISYAIMTSISFNSW